MTETKWGKALTGSEMKALRLPDGTEYGVSDAFGFVHLCRKVSGSFSGTGNYHHLPENHPAYIVHETNKRTGSRFKFHAGGPKPAGEIVRFLFPNGRYGRSGKCTRWEWTNGGEGGDIIGYELAVDVSGTPVDDNQSDLMSTDDTQADTVTIRRMTEWEWKAMWAGLGGIDTARSLGLIREETREEQFTRATGHAVTDAVAAALNWGR